MSHVKFELVLTTMPIFTVGYLYDIYVLEARS